MRSCNFLFLIFSLLHQFSTISAQQTANAIYLPPLTVWADQHIKGDTDLYGLGDWSVEASAHATQMGVLVDVHILFRENANDLTTLMGKSSVFVPFSVQERSSSVHDQFGRAQGKNIGARGTRRFDASGIVAYVELCTDTFGDDLGRVGGTVVFRPLVYLSKDRDEQEQTAAARPLPVFVQ